LLNCAVILKEGNPVLMSEPGTISYDPNHDYMSCSCGNTDRLDGFDSLTDLSGLGHFRLFVLDWLVRLGVVPVGAVSHVSVCTSCGAFYCIPLRELRIAGNYRRRLEHAATQF
jgi:hypothetical protein